MSFETDPDYLAARAEHLAALQVARATSDELAEARAEISWLTKSNTIRDRVRESEAAAAKRAVALEQIKAEYPLVPQSLLDSIQDPDTLLVVAKDLYAKMPTAPAATSGGNSWGNAQAPAGSGSGGRKTSRKSDDRGYVNGLIERVNKNEGGKEGAVKEYKDMVWKDRVMPWQERMKG